MHVAHSPILQLAENNRNGTIAAVVGKRLVGVLGAVVVAEGRLVCEHSFYSVFLISITNMIFDVMDLKEIKFGLINILN